MAPQQAHSLRLWGVCPRVAKVQLVAKFADVELESVPNFTFGVTNRTPDFLENVNPSGQVPVLETAGGMVQQSNAICRFLAGMGDGKLYPTAQSPTQDIRAFIDGWIDWSFEFPNLWPDLVLPLLGWAPGDRGAHYRSLKTLADLFAVLERHLASRTYLVGQSITIADIVVAFELLPFYHAYCDSAFAAKVPVSMRWLDSVYGHPSWVAFLPVHAPSRAITLDAKGAPSEDFTTPELRDRFWGNPWTGNRVRQAFLDFFASQGHSIVPSSSVVPHNDPTLLFANAGMNQFKSIFLGTVDPSSHFAKMKRASAAQKCIRAGGKHNDLDDVGKDVYHHTFFEMLGNWSFGDYFKAEAIDWAWKLLTEVYKLEPSRLYATYFGGDKSQGLPSDEEARELWEKKLPAARVLPFGCEDNFWEMGDQGPCGPCSELHYDRIGGRDASALVNMDDADVLEIWNIVFIQYNREADASLKSLPAKHVDTGMGMERVTSILQNKRSNYATDLFTPIFDAIHALGNKPPYQDRVGTDDPEGTDMAYRVVADHIRTLTFAIADGAGPGAEGRDYVLRRVLRRAVRYGQQKLGAKDGFFCTLVDVVVENFGGYYPELRSNRNRVFSVIQEEETSFSRTLQKGIKRYKTIADSLMTEGKERLDGKVLFELWDTFGFPPDLTDLMAQEDGLQVDLPGFQAAMTAARELSRAGQKKGGIAGIKFEAAETAHLKSKDVPTTDDSPKYAAEDVETSVLHIVAPDGSFPESTQGLEGSVGVIVGATSFYAEQGGQVTDTGVVAARARGGATLQVDSAQVAAGYVLHCGTVTDGVLCVGDAVATIINRERRNRVMPNHTFTHVLNFALKEQLGEHVAQKGSIVLPDRLRFDFSHPGVIEPAKLKAIEKMCRDSLDAHHVVYSKEVPLAQARSINGLRAVFGEVYPDPVRVVSIGRSVEDLIADPTDSDNAAFSVEFCGGTHLADTSAAKAFALLSEEGIAKGVRRIVAVTAAEAAEAIQLGEKLRTRTVDARQLSPDKLEREVAALKKVVDDSIVPAAVKAELRADVTALVKALQVAQKGAAADNKAKAVSETIAAAAVAASAGDKCLALRVDVGSDSKALIDATTAAQKEHPTLPVILFSCDTGKGKAMVFAGVPKDLSTKLNAGQWLNTALAPLGGRGGGKPVAAQGSGPKVEALGEALDIAKTFALERLQ